MKAGVCPLLSLFVLVCTCKALTNITADVGQDVILSVKVFINKTITAVEWSRPDQDPEKYVLLYRDGHFDPYNQHPSYKNRVDLQDKEMKDGDVSLILKNVMKEDTGTYKCRVFQKETNDLNTKTNYTVYLEVHPPGDQDGGDNVGIIVGSVVGVILLLAVALVGFLIYRRCIRQNPNLPFPVHHNICLVADEAAEQML